MYSAFLGDFANNSNVGDTTLRLDGFGYTTRDSPSFRNSKSQINNGSRVTFTNALDQDAGCKLVLGLGLTPIAFPDEYSPSLGDKAKGVTTVLNEGPSSQCDSFLKLCPYDGPDAVPNVLDFSASTHSPFDAPLSNEIPVVDEGSTSAKKSGGYMTGLILAPRVENSVSMTKNNLSEQVAKSRCQISQLSSDYSMSAISEPGSATMSSDCKNSSNTKKCKFLGCTKGARGVTGLCIGHGGGQRCQKPGCSKGAESRTAYCKAHGGGRRCEHLGCTKSAEGKTDYCISHGGGRRCGHPDGCTKAARGKSGLCIKHGGGKRCTVEGCARSAEGQIGLCISHGGGRRCQFVGCAKGAQGSTAFCKAHGGGRRCLFTGCTKGAEGSTPLCKGHGGGKRCMFDGGGICPKSVHGGTSFCVAHGGGKRCVVSGCTKSARGRTDCCVRHGGGKRCAVADCTKSAQGSTDFCKAHGGGKRCGWEEGKCEKFARGKSGLCAAHASLVRGRGTNRRGVIGPGLFSGLVTANSTATNTWSGLDNTCSSSGVSVVSDSSFERPAKRLQFIPPEVLVPLSMKVSPFSSGSGKPVEKGNGDSSGGGGKRLDFVVPEGRVHGGGLLSLLGGNLNNAFDGI